MEKSNKYILVIIVLVLIGILACVITQKFGKQPKEVSSQNTTNSIENTSFENKLANNAVNETNENTVKEPETNTVSPTNEVTTNSNIETVYDGNTDVGTTDKKQQAIELVKQMWGEDDSVSYRCDSITKDGKYIIAVVSLETASVKNYFSVDLETKNVEVDY